MRQLGLVLGLGFGFRDALGVSSAFRSFAHYVELRVPSPYSPLRNESVMSSFRQTLSANFLPKA